VICLFVTQLRVTRKEILQEKIERLVDKELMMKS
jgi:hypothetical protein